MKIAISVVCAYILCGLIAVFFGAKASAGNPTSLRLEVSQETTVGSVFSDPAFQRWHDDERRVTCYALRTQRGTALSCMSDTELTPYVRP